MRLGCFFKKWLPGAVLLAALLMIPSFRAEAGTAYRFVPYYRIYQSEMDGTRYQSGDWYFYTEMLSSGAERLFAAKDLTSDGKRLFTDYADAGHVSNLLVNDQYAFFAKANADNTYYGIYRIALAGDGKAAKITGAKCNPEGELLIWGATGGKIYYTLSAPSDGQQRLYSCDIASGKNTRVAEDLYVEARNARYLYLSAYADPYVLHIFDMRTGEIVNRMEKPDELQTISKVFLKSDRMYVVLEFQENTGEYIYTVLHYALDGSDMKKVAEIRKDGVSIGDVTRYSVYYSVDDGDGDVAYFRYKQSTGMHIPISEEAYKDTY